MGRPPRNERSRLRRPVAHLAAKSVETETRAQEAAVPGIHIELAMAGNAEAAVARRRRSLTRKSEGGVEGPRTEKDAVPGIHNKLR